MCVCVCVCVCVHHIFIHLSTNEQLGCFHVLTIVICAPKTQGCEYLFELEFCLLLI